MKIGLRCSCIAPSPTFHWPQNQKVATKIEVDFTTTVHRYHTINPSSDASTDLANFASQSCYGAQPCCSIARTPSKCILSAQTLVRKNSMSCANIRVPSEEKSATMTRDPGTPGPQFNVVPSSSQRWLEHPSSTSSSRISRRVHLHIWHWATPIVKSGWQKSNYTYPVLG